MTYKLGPTSGRCASHGIVGGFIALLGVGLVVFALGVFAEYSGSQDLAFILMAVVFLLPSGAIFLIYGMRVLREYAFRGAKLTIDARGLTIEDRHGLLAPVVAPLDQVVRCAIQEGSARNPGFMFPIVRSLGWANAYREGSSTADRGWLIQPGSVRAGILPMGASDVNLLLVFDRPQFFQIFSRVEGERKRLKAFAWNQAVVLPAREAEQIVNHLASLGIHGPLEEADVDRLTPVTHAEVGDPPKITDMLREMGWAYQPAPGQMAQLDTLQVPQAAADHAFFSGDDTSPMGLTREQLHRRISHAVTRFYVSIAIVVLGIAGFGVWLLLTAPKPTGGILVLIWAGLLARAGLQRPAEFEPEESVAIALEEHPRLLHEITGVARVLEVQSPDYVDVTFESNGQGESMSTGAGEFGYRAKLSLPLLGLLTASEARALLAHELTHAKNEGAHDASMNRAAHRAWLMSIAFSSSRVGIATRIITRSFMRSLRRFSREIEFLADRTAVEVAGPDALASALRKMAIAEHHLPMYWDHWVVPALDRGMHPPLIAGFRDYLRQATNGLDLAIEGDRWARASGSGDFSGLQPQIDHRIAAIEQNFSPQRGASMDFAGGQLLADDGYNAERALLGLLAGWDRSNALRQVQWSEVFGTPAAPEMAVGT